jgi:hypothetical protein
VRYFLILFLTCCACVGQSVTIGVLGGGRLTSDITSDLLPAATPESKRYVVGPSVELSLPWNFAIEADALYRRQGYQAFVNLGSPQQNTITNERERANSWEFPILLKYKLPAPVIKPFIEAGVAPRRVTGTVTDSIEAFSPVTNPSTNLGSANFARSDAGIVVGGGVQISLGRLRISPEARYTHWSSAFANGLVGVSTSQQQVDLAVGVGWKFR